MRGRKRIVAAVLAALAAGLGASAAPGQQPTKPAAAGRHVTVDKAKRQVIIEAAVSLQQGPLEFLLCKEGTKDYESVLTTKAAPSALHAALLALGLMPGKPAQWNTPPGKEPVFLPPQGALLEIALRWTDAKGAQREAPGNEWLLTAGTKKPAPAMRWVFVGSDFLDDGQYWADVEGQCISVANFASTVLDVPFKSTDKNALLEFVVNGQIVPGKGTPVQVVLTAVKGAETAPVARVSFAVDHLGRIEYEGRAIAPDDIPAAVKQFLAQHSQGAADVRLDPRALIYDQDALKDVLQDAGLTDVTFRRVALSAEVLPRTAAQQAKAIAWWKEQFARAKDLITDPGDDAAAALKNIQKRQQELQALSELWTDYADQVRALADDYRARRDKEKAATQPAKP